MINASKVITLSFLILFGVEAFCCRITVTVMQRAVFAKGSSESERAKSSIENIKKLLKKGIDINSQDNYGKRTALHMTVATNSKKLKELKFLLNKGANANIRDHYDATPLHLAVAYKNMKRLSTLVPHTYTKHIKTALSFAKEQKTLLKSMGLKRFKLKYRTRCRRKVVPFNRSDSQYNQKIKEELKKKLESLGIKDIEVKYKPYGVFSSIVYDSIMDRQGMYKIDDKELKKKREGYIKKFDEIIKILSDEIVYREKLKKEKTKKEEQKKERN